jgi:hypothetical protein
MPSERKLRLFACACARLVLAGETRRVRHAVQVAERYADGQVGWGELKRVRHAVLYGQDHLPWWEMWLPEVTNEWWWPWGDVGDTVTSPEIASAVWELGQWAFVGDRNGPTAALIRDIFGSPFRDAATVDLRWLAWQGGAVARLAQAIYEDRTYDLLGVLADALQEAGCGDADILDHLRGPGPHTRGCWALDHCLGKM